MKEASLLQDVMKLGHCNGSKRSLTCTLSGDHFWFAASTISFHGVGGYGNGICSLRLEPSNDHLLFARFQKKWCKYL